MSGGRRAILAGGAVAVLAWASPVVAEGCRLALVLALDVSDSVDGAEYGLQREGLARALRDPEVARAFLTGDPVALQVFEWASPSMQEALLPDWSLVQGPDDLDRVAAALLGHPRTGAGDARRSTAVGAALAHAAEVLNAGPACRARTVDVSGDGRNNVGLDPRDVYAGHGLDGVTVNALAVGGAGPASGHPNDLDELTAWFRSHVLHGRDAFLVPADDYEDFQRAMEAKLLRELRVPEVSGWPATESAG